MEVKTKQKQNMVANLLLILSAASFMVLQYTGGSKPLFAAFFAVGFGLTLGISFRAANLGAFFRKSLKVETVILSAVTAAFFSIRFGVNAVDSGIIQAVAGKLGVGSGFFAWLCTVGGGLLSVYGICLFYGYLDSLAQRSKETAVPQALTFDAGVMLKGLMVIVMVIHHAFGFPEWYRPGISYPAFSSYVEIIRETTKICVGVFAVLTGYTYALHRDQSFRYSLRKIGSFLKTYGITWLTVLLLAVGVCGYRPAFWELVMEWLMLRNGLIMFGWYVYFYILCMLVLPLSMKYVKKRDSLPAELMVFLSLWALALVACPYLEQVRLLAVYLENFILYFFCIPAGYFLAKYRILDRWICACRSRLPGWACFGTGLAVTIAALVFRNQCNGFFAGEYWVLLDFVYAPLLVMGLLLLALPKAGLIGKGLGVCGKHSLLIWLLHSVFYADALGDLFQPIAYLPKEPVLVVLWILLLCLMGSAALGVVEKLPSKIRRR